MRSVKKILSSILAAALMMSSLGNVAYAAEGSEIEGSQQAGNGQVTEGGSQEGSGSENKEDGDQGDGTGAGNGSGAETGSSGSGDGNGSGATDPGEGQNPGAADPEEGQNPDETLDPDAADPEAILENQELTEEELLEAQKLAEEQDLLELEDDFDYDSLFPDGFEGMVDDDAASRGGSSDGLSAGEMEFLGGNSGDVINIDITGTYYTLSAEKILAQINKMRYEACEQKLYLNGKNLSLADYKPLKWSYELEEAARIRALEAGITIAHERLATNMDVWTLDDQDNFWGGGENLAWNNNHDASGITYGINQFYAEKKIYEQYLKDGKYHGVTGHYTSMIDPSNEYVGVAACLQSNVTPYGWIAVAMRLGGKANNGVTIDQTKNGATGKITYTVPATAGNISGLSITGSGSVPKNGTSSYGISGKYTYHNSHGNSSASFKIPAERESGVVWTSSDESIATVSNSGVVTGVTGGTASITAGVGAKSVSKNVLVTVPIESISLKCDTIGSGVLNDKEFTLVREDGASNTISVEYLPEDATDTKAVTWKSSNTGVVTIDGKGKYTLKKPGTAVITATCKTTNPNKPTVTASFTINVISHIKSIALNKTSAVLNYTGAKAPTLQLNVSVTPADASDDKSVIWTSEDPRIATVSDKGLVTAVRGGTTKITAKVGTFTQTCDIKVNAPVKGITLSDSKKKLYTTVDSSTVTVTLNPTYTSDRDVTFTSSDTSVFTLSDGSGPASDTVTITSDEGVATVTLHRVSDANGEATLTVLPANAKLKKVIPIVIAKPTDRVFTYVGADETDLAQGCAFTLDAGTIMSFGAVSEPDDAYDTSVKWSSSNTNVATVDASGNVTALRKGTATITASSDNAPAAVESSFTVNVVMNPSSVSLNRNAVTCYEGEKYQLVASVQPAGLEDAVTFESMNTAVATVDESGLISAVHAGEAAILATCGSRTRTCHVTVIASDVLPGDTPFEGEEASGIWVASQSFNSSVQYTGGKILQNDLRVYYGRKLLKEKNDYTLAYKNNVNVAAADTNKSPQVTITLKGQYQGKRTYSYAITAVNIEDESLITEKGTVTTNFNKKAQKLIPELFFGNIKLKNKTDFTCLYEDTAEGAYVQPGTYNVTVSGRGNYTGTRTWKFTVTNPAMNLAKAAVTVKPADPTVKKIFYVDNFTASELDVTVKAGGAVIDPSYYEISDLPTKAGNWNIKIAATAAGNAEGYYGYKFVKINTQAQPINKAVVEDLEPSFVYNYRDVKAGGIKQPAVKLKYGEELLAEGRDYTVSYAGNTNVGTAKIIFTGKGRFGGSLSKSYKILPNAGDGLTVTSSGTMRYRKGGVSPLVTVRDGNGNILNGKTDYSINILAKSNNKPGTMRFVIVGKGNFKGYRSEEQTMTITNGVLADATMTVADRAYSPKVNAWKSGIKLVDTNGKTLAAGVDYDKNLVYSYQGMNESPVPAAGTTVYVTAIGKGAYAGSHVTGSYRIFATNITKYAVVIDSKTYITREIEPKAHVDIHLYPSAKDAKAGTNEITDDIYEVIGYTANINSGNGRVTLRGKGNCGGTRVCNFKISKKSW